MPVTTRVAPVEVMPAPALSTYNCTSLFQLVCPNLWQEDETSVIDSSFPAIITIRPTRYFGKESANGFVGTLLDAYRMHNHVVLRPEDVWFSILTQFSFYINAHAEQLREHFVDHAGKIMLTIRQEVMNSPAFFTEMAGLLHKTIKDSHLRDWVMPNFTTTTTTDKVTASIIMMGTMQKYFVYSWEVICGIPSVTMLGDENDWQDILNRVDYLSTFATDHPELAMWQSALRGIVSHMVHTFKAPDSPHVVHFWQRAIHSFSNDYRGAKRISGWILAFCFWDTDGKLLAGRYSKDSWEMNLDEQGREWWFKKEAFRSLAWNKVPSTLVSVPIHLNNLGDKSVVMAVAGPVGYTVRDSEQIFQSTRLRGERRLDLPAETLVAEHCELSTQGHGFLAMLVRKLLCLKMMAQAAFSRAETGISLYWPFPARQELTHQEHRHVTEDAPQISDLSELDQVWAYEHGGKSDTLQPVTGWWVIRSSEQYGRDPDVPNVQYDSDAKDYDKDLAEKGKPLRERNEL
ncbi:hypothetical protein N0V90_005994 [Kalmusia sp. IMI 367209]|nr:hypothetical protein N0V90_005994 [Kalmusia sp. IMI 367209]